MTDAEIIKRLEDENRRLRFEVEQLESQKKRYDDSDRPRMLHRIHRLERLLTDSLMELEDEREKSKTVAKMAGVLT